MWSTFSIIWYFNDSYKNNLQLNFFQIFYEEKLDTRLVNLVEKKTPKKKKYALKYYLNW